MRQVLLLLSERVLALFLACACVYVERWLFLCLQPERFFCCSQELCLHHLLLRFVPNKVAALLLGGSRTLVVTTEPAPSLDS